MRAQIYVEMQVLKDFDLSFFGLKTGKHRFEYEVDKQFFEHFEFDEYLDASFKVDLDFVKKATLLELHFEASGIGTLMCDLSNEQFEQPLSAELDLIVKFGEEYNDDNEEVLILPHGEHQMNVAQYIYEMLVLALPNKKIHPGVTDGTLNSEVLERLKALEPNQEKENNDTDPRWDELKKLLIDKNK